MKFRRAVMAVPARWVPGDVSEMRVPPGPCRGGRHAALMVPLQGRLRGRMLLVAALVAAWVAVVVAVWWRGPARPAPPASATAPPPAAASPAASDARPVAPARPQDGQGMQPRTSGTGR